MEGTLLRLWEYLKHSKGRLILVVLIVLLTTALNIAGPYLMKIALDEHIAGGVDLPALFRILGLMAAAYLSAALMTLIQQWIMIGISQKAIKDLRNDVFRKFQELDYPLLRHPLPGRADEPSDQ